MPGRFCWCRIISTPTSPLLCTKCLSARRLAEHFEWRYTPKHGSWLNMAESELAVIAKQCLDRRIPDQPTPDQPTLGAQVSAWQNDRNTNHSTADWRFTTADARIKLKRLHPTF